MTRSDWLDEKKCAPTAPKTLCFKPPVVSNKTKNKVIQNI